jgi:hypothetical protein
MDQRLLIKSGSRSLGEVNAHLRSAEGIYAMLSWGTAINHNTNIDNQLVAQKQSFYMIRKISQGDYSPDVK